MASPFPHLPASFSDSLACWCCVVYHAKNNQVGMLPDPHGFFVHSHPVAVEAVRALAIESELSSFQNSNRILCVENLNF